MTSYTHSAYDPSWLCDAPSDSRTLIFYFEYVNTRRGIYYANEAAVGGIVGSYGIKINTTDTNEHRLYVNSGKVYFDSCINNPPLATGWFGAPSSYMCSPSLTLFKSSRHHPSLCDPIVFGYSDPEYVSGTPRRLHAAHVGVPFWAELD